MVMIHENQILMMTRSLSDFSAVISPFRTYPRVCSNSNTTGATCGAGITYPPNIIVCTVVFFSFGHSIACPFWLMASNYNIGILRHFLLIFNSHSNLQTSNLYPIYLQMSHPTQFWNGLKKLSYILTYNKYKVLSEYIVGLVIFMVFIATFNNISALSWRSVLLMKETGIPGENQRPVASHGQTLNIWVDSCYCYLYIYLYNQLFYRQFRCM